MSSAAANVPSQIGTVVIPELYAQHRGPDTGNGLGVMEEDDFTSSIQSGTPVSQPRTTDWMEAQLSDCLL